VAMSLVRKVGQQFVKMHPETDWANQKQDVSLKTPWLKEMFTKYQKPEEADDMMVIQQNLDKTKEIILESLELLIEREEKLDRMIEKSNDLSIVSKKFGDNAADLTRCCVLF